MTDFYWVSTTPGALSSDATQWSLTPAGAPLVSWPGSSPDTADDFFFDETSTANCTWDNSLAPTMNDVNSIQQSLDQPFTGVLTISIDLILNGLILNGEITDGGAGNTITFSGTSPTALDDSSSKKRYVLNGQFAQHSSGSTLLYKMTPPAADYHLDNGPYNKLTIDNNSMTLAYNVPTSTAHDYADTATIHIKSDFTAALAGGFVRQTAPNGAEDSKVKIKFDTTNFTYSAPTLDFIMATAFFRGTEIPVTGSQTYGTTSAGFTATHYGLVVFASSNGELSTIRNGLNLNCYSLEVKAGARFTVQSDSGKPTKINSQTQPIIKGVWSFQSSDGHEYISPRKTHVAAVGSGGTGLSQIEPNALLVGNTASAMHDMNQIPPGTNGYVLTMVGGTPAWAAAGGGGGAVSSVFGRTGAVVATEGDYDLDELGDVALTSPEEPQILVYDDASSGWINDTNDRLFIRVKNDTASTLSKGKAVYITGYQNANTAKVELAKADSSSTMPAVGVMYTDVAAGGEGYIVALGKANGVVANYTAGDTLYVSPSTAGELTNTRPTAASHLVQNVGILFKPDATNAVMKVTGVGRTNDVPNDISAVSATFTGDVDIGGKLTVTGLIDPTGLELDPQSENPGNVDANTLWLDSDDSNRAKIGSSRIIQAGDNVGDLADDGTYATAAQGATADAALPTTGGTMTGEIEGTTITLNAVPADPATDDKVRLGESGATQNMLRIQTNDGYLDIGPNNSGYSHFYTNRNTFYMNKPLVVDGGGEIFAYNDGLKLGTGTSVSAGTVAIEVADGSPDITVAGTTTSTGFIKTGGSSSEALMADGSVFSGFLTAGQAETDTFTVSPPGAPTNWAGLPPNTIGEAINRIAAALSDPAYVTGTPIP